MRAFRVRLLQPDRVERLAILPGGRVLCAVAGAYGRVHIIWHDIATGEELARSETPPHAVSADGTLLAFGEPAGYLLHRPCWGEWSAGRGSATRGPGAWGSLPGLAFTPDNRELVALTDRQPSPVQVPRCDVATGAALPTVTVTGWRFAFVPSPVRLAALAFRDADWRLTLADWPDGTGAVECEATEFSLPSAFSPDGRWVATASADRTVKLWDAATFTETHSFAWKIGRLTAVTFAPDGLTMAAASETGHVVVWDV